MEICQGKIVNKDCITMTMNNDLELFASLVGLV